MLIVFLQSNHYLSSVDPMLVSVIENAKTVSKIIIACFNEYLRFLSSSPERILYAASA